MARGPHVAREAFIVALEMATKLFIAVLEIFTLEMEKAVCKTFTSA